MANHPVDVHCGRRVRDFREEKGLSQKDLAAALNISFQQVQKYEAGSNRISMSRCWEICNYLRIVPADLFEGLPRKVDKRTANKLAKDTADGRGHRQTLELNRAFAGVTDKDARRQVLALTKTLARIDAPVRMAAY